MNRQLYIFDFDGTLTTKDSLPDFIKFAVGTRRYYHGLFRKSATLIGYKLGLIPNYRAKEQFIGYFFKDWDHNRFKSVANAYSTTEIDKILRPKALKQIEDNRKNGHRMVVVSASIEDWISGWCEKHQLDLIATRLEVVDGKLTGKFATKNCYGIEKVRRIKAQYVLEDFEEVHVYGDSPGDREMLKLGDHAYYRYF